MLIKERREEECFDLVSIEIRGLHIDINSSKHGKNSFEYNVKKLILSVHRIFHENPSQRSMKL